MGGVTTKRGRPKDEALTCRRREELLAAAARVFARQGYPGTDVQQIADACGMAKGTIYLYFPSKESLFIGAVERAMQRLREAVRAAHMAIADPIEKLRAAVKAYFEFFQQHPDHAELMIIERAEYRDRKTPSYHQLRESASAEWKPVYEGLIRDGRFRDIPVDRIYRVVGDLVCGMMFTNHFTGRSRTPEEQARDVMDILLNGVLSEKERRKQST